jgi:hypothetical protein
MKPPSGCLMAALCRSPSVSSVAAQRLVYILRLSVLRRFPQEILPILSLQSSRTSLRLFQDFHGCFELADTPLAKSVAGKSCHTVHKTESLAPAWPSDTASAETPVLSHRRFSATVEPVLGFLPIRTYSTSLEARLKGCALVIM